MGVKEEPWITGSIFGRIDKWGNMVIERESWMGQVLLVGMAREFNVPRDDLGKPIEAEDVTEG